MTSSYSAKPFAPQTENTLHKFESTSDIFVPIRDNFQLIKKYVLKKLVFKREVVYTNMYTYIHIHTHTYIYIYI